MFSGTLNFLSNMYPCLVTIQIGKDTFTFQSSEAAFQAGKCMNPKDISLFVEAKTGYVAKHIGRKVKMRPDWDVYRIQWMQQVVQAKFEQNPGLKTRLLETYPLELVETNTWRDTFWGVCNGVGENHLGRILMDVRESFRKDVCENEDNVSKNVVK